MGMGMREFKGLLEPSSLQEISSSCDFYLGRKCLMVNSSLGFVNGRSNGLVNLGLTESWWTCAIQGGRVFGPSKWTKGGPYKCELIKFYPKQYICVCMKCSYESNSHTTIRVKEGALTSIFNANNINVRPTPYSHSTVRVTLTRHLPKDIYIYIYKRHTRCYLGEVFS